MIIKSECIKNKTDKIIVLKEKKSSFIVGNKNQIEIEVVKVDGCVIKTGKRCNYMLRYDSKEIYIELKGRDVNYAVEQIKSTIEKISLDKDLYQKESYIVSTKSPRLDTTIQAIKRNFKKMYNSSLKIKSLKCRIEIS